MTVLRTQLRGLASRPSRILLTAIAVAVATAFAFGTVIAEQILERTVVDGLSGTPANASLVVSGGGEHGLSNRDVDAINKIPGVTETAPRATAVLAVTGVANGGPYWSVTGDAGTGKMSPLHLLRGTYPRGPTEIAVGERTARDAGLSPGSRLTVIPDTNKPRIMLVTAVVKSDRGDDGTQLFAPAATTEKLVGGGYYRAELRVDSGADVAAVTDRLRAVLGANASVRDASAVRTEEANEAAASVRSLFALVGTFVFVAVLAAVLVTASTFRIVFAQRMRQLALLRAVGAGRRPIIGSLIVEGALTGAVAGILGVLGAIGLSYGARSILAAAGHQVADPGIPIGAAVACLVGAVIVTTAAVLAPAVAASRVRPLEALRTSALADTRPRAGIVRIGFGVLLLLAAGGLAVLAITMASSSDEQYHDPTASLLLLVTSGAAAFGALLALGPFVVPAIARIIGWPMVRAGGIPGQLALRGAVRAPRRVAATTAVVALGIALVTSVLVGSASLRGYADAELAGRFPADVLVSSANSTAVPSTLVQKLRADQRMEHVVEVRQAEVTLTGRGRSDVTNAKGLTARELPALNKVGVDSGRLHDIAPGQVAIGRDIAKHTGVEQGDLVTLTVGKRHLSAQITAVYAGSEALGSVLIDTADMRRLAPSTGVSSLLVGVRDRTESGIDAARAAAVTAAGQGSTVVVQTPARERAEIDEALSIVSGIALGLLGLTVLIAVVGVATTMALAVVERTREFGLLRALGLGRRGLRSSIALESSLFGLVGAVMGLGVGVLYGWMALGTMQLPMTLVLPIGSLAGAVLLVVALAGIAGLLPSRRAAKTSPVAVLGTE